MKGILAEVDGYAPHGLVSQLRSVRWKRIRDAEGGKLFPGISLAGRHLVKAGGSEPLACRVVITDMSTGDSIEIAGRTFDFVPRRVAETKAIRIMTDMLDEEAHESLAHYNVQIFPSDEVY